MQYVLYAILIFCLFVNPLDTTKLYNAIDLYRKSEFHDRSVRFLNCKYQSNMSQPSKDEKTNHYLYKNDLIDTIYFYTSISI